MKDKFILDACCGGRMMWFNKKHPNTLYIDIRKEKAGFIKEIPNFKINPDIIMDFRKLKFKDNSFKLVVLDPPHLVRAGEGIFKKKFGGLIPETWQDDLKRGFKECCMTWNFSNRNYCAYFQRKLNPDQQACLQFSTCNKCSSRAMRIWKRFVERKNG